ncbi:MAG: 16S rRNA (cytosine(1402)-N(4))-methyltransferase RsmH [Fibrobacteria bacterium]|nr:16S rRNA (cytosine(1402)-N(4))-methyltransferase RsmH [Fibrobacteria bacterium]
MTDAPSDSPLDIRHVPVLASRIASLLRKDGRGTWFDCTLGDGGHSSVLLSVLGPEARVIGLDRDPQALAIAGARLGSDPRFQAVHLRFSALGDLPEATGALGFLFDFGVSSRQLDEDDRGFTIRPGATLDLRMDPTASGSLAEVLRGLDEESLSRALYELADVPRARTVARHLLERQASGETLRSDDLEGALRTAFPNGMRDRPREMARLSMALRMIVNDELGEIRTALPTAWSSLAVGGRLAVLTYHSVEDRLAKNLLRGLIGDDPDAPRDIYGNRPERDGAWVVRGETPDAEEIASNPRARSARLRVVEKTRGSVVPAVLVGFVAITLLASMMVGCVWRQTRHVELESRFTKVSGIERRLRDSVDQLSGRLAALRRPDAMEARASRWGWVRPGRQYRLPEPDTQTVVP